MIRNVRCKPRLTVVELISANKNRVCVAWFIYFMNTLLMITIISLSVFVFMYCSFLTKSFVDTASSSIIIVSFRKYESQTPRALPNKS